MKKLMSVVSLAALLGFGVLASQHATIVLPGAEKAAQKTYIVRVNGDVRNDSKAAEIARNEVLNELAYKLPKDSYQLNAIYDTVLNGFSLSIDPELKDAVASISGVSSVQMEHRYAVPTDDGTTGTSTGMTDAEIKAAKLTNYSAVSMHATGTEISDAIKDVTGTAADTQGGKGVVVGIIDTGLYLNQVTGTEARTSAETTASSGKYTLNAPAFQDLTATGTDTLTTTKIAAAKAKSDFIGKTATRVNNKIAYAYDYADGDGNVDPTGGSAGEHGTHVASMVAANGTEFNGIAPNAQVAVLKVFPDAGGGAPTTAIISALDDAAKLGLDVVNLSLGTDLYDYDDSKDDSTYIAAKGATDAGVIVNFAAGNSGKSSFSGTKGYADWSMDTVETGMLGSDANLDETVNVIAASNPDKAFFDSIMTVNGTAVSYDDQVVNRTGSSLHFDEPHKLADLIPSGSTSTELKYVRIGGNGETADFTDDIKAQITAGNNIAVINRGVTTFTSKVQAAVKAGAKAVIMVNNDSSVTFNFSFDFGGYNPEIPVVLVFKSMSSVFGAVASTGSITLAKNSVQNTPDGRVISSFSSDGPSYNLDIAPTLTAPGKEIIGAVSALTMGTNSSLYGYDNYSGTSMATPNTTGAMALALGEKKSTNAGSLAVADDAAFTAYKAKLSYLAMSTADQIYDTTTTHIASPRLQGAGQIDPRNILAADTYVTYENQDLGGFSNTIESKAELKNLGSLKVTDIAASTDPVYIDFNYTVTNDSKTARTYKPTLSVMIPQLRVQETKADYDASTADSKKDIPTNLPDAITMSVNDDEVTVPTDHQPTDNITVAAGASVKAEVKVRIDDLAFSKAWDDTAVEDFTGTLKEYVAKYFSDAGGSYVEGYLHLDEVGVTADATKPSHKLTMPYLGFYGDYTKGAAVEDFDFEKKDGHLYNSDMIDAHMHNLSNATYARNNAYTGSTLSAVSASKSVPTTSISDMQSSALANGTSFLSVTGKTGDTKLYAGAAGVSDKLVAVFFINRSIDEGTWTIKQGTTSKLTGTVQDIFATNGVTGLTSLTKSWLVTGDNGYEMHHGYSEINIAKLAEGEYTLQFDFKLHATGTTQTKSYTLVVDKSLPTLSQASIVTKNEKQYVRLVTNGGSAKYSANGVGLVPTLVDGTTDTYTADVALKDANITADTITISAEDYAHNVTNFLIHPSDTSFMASSVEFTKSMQLSVQLLSSKKGVYSYDVSVSDLSGNTVTLKKDYVLYIQLATGLDSDSFDVTIDGDTASNISYDTTTGILAVSMPKDATSVAINQKVVNPLNPGTSTDSTSSAPTSSVVTSSVPAETSSASSSSATTKKGCGGTIVAASSVIGAAALLGVALAIKHKKEQK